MVELHYAVGDQRTVLDKVVDNNSTRAGFHLVLLDEGKNAARLSGPTTEPSA